MTFDEQQALGTLVQAGVYVTVEITSPFKIQGRIAAVTCFPIGTLPRTLTLVNGLVIDAEVIACSDVVVHHKKGIETALKLFRGVQ